MHPETLCLLYIINREMNGETFILRLFFTDFLGGILYCMSEYLTHSIYLRSSTYWRHPGNMSIVFTAPLLLINNNNSKIDDGPANI